MNKKYTEKHIKLLNKQIKEHFPRIFPIQDDMKVTREGISRMVMLDRYAQKDASLKTLEPGDLVIAKIKYDPTFPTLGIGYVLKVMKDKVEIEVEEEYVALIDPSLRPSGNKVTLAKQLISKPLEIFYEQIAKRVGYHLAENENQKYADEFSKEIAKGNIVPAGRVLYGAGSGTKVTYFNCFVMPMPKDSREGIAEHRREVMEIMSRGGGVGTNGSTLRPKDAIAITVGGKSSGAVSWLNDLSTLTDLVQQGGSRRGAQMIMLQDWHPDILEFIISKMQKPEILKYISEKFSDPDIRQLAKDKLRFKPYTSFEREMLDTTLIHAKDSKVREKAFARLEAGGTYEVASPNFLTGANISVGITKEFMDAVKNDSDYELRFPDIEKMSKSEKEFYDKEWHNIGDVREWEKMGYPVKVYKTIKAVELWDLINFSATYSAEPGVFFIDRANEATNAKAYGQKVVCTNPCGEQPLAAYSVCNLAALNLANMVDKKTKEVKWDKLRKTIRTSIRMQDNIIDKTPYFLKANESQATGERRIGMGVMGLHDLLIWSNLRYGSKQANQLVDKLFEFIASEAYIKSAELASEKGPFSFQRDLESLLNTGYIKKLPKKVINIIKENGGLRNSHLLTIAPTGSTGTMMGVSTGLEPYFAFKYFRSGRLGKFMEVDQEIVAEWRKENKFKGETLPHIFVSAMDLTPEEHADTQAVIQRWVDSSISKTVNAPKGYTVKQVERIYQRLYDKGAKGGTVYVDGSRDSQVLSLGKDISDTAEINIIVSEKAKEQRERIKEGLKDVPGLKADRKMGSDLGDLCPICKEGTVEFIGGCHSCSNCGAQLKCGL